MRSLTREVARTTVACAATDIGIVPVLAALLTVEIVSMLRRSLQGGRVSDGLEGV